MLLLYRLLRGRKYRQARRKPFDPANPPRPLRWRPKLKVYGVVSGAIGGLGAVILLAQYGISPVTTRALSTRGALSAAGSGIVLPSLIFAVVVWRFNRKLARAGLHPGRGGPRLPSPAVGAVMLVGAATLAITLLAATAQAGAEVDGPCAAVFAGVDAGGLTTSTGDAIEVPEDGAVTYGMAAPEELQTWRFWLQYGPLQQLIADGDKDEPDPGDLGLGLDPDDDFLIDFEGILGAPVVEGNSITGAVATSDYAWMGAGLYEVHGSVTTVSGQACSGVILIDVQGNPLATLLGAAAAGATAIGLAGAGAVVLGGLRDGGERLDELEDLPDWRKEELADQDRFREEVMGAAEADWADRKQEIDAERARQDDLLREEIRAGRARIDAAETYLERRQEILERLEAGEASQAELDEWAELWRQVRDDAFDGMVRDVDSLPDFVRESGAATRQRLGEAYDAATDPENWRVLAETAGETTYDAAGLVLTGGVVGDATEDIAESYNDVTELGGQVAEAAARDPWGFVTSLTPLQAIEDALDPTKPLGERLVAVGTATVDIGLTLAGGGLLAGADDVLDAAKVADRVDDAVDAAKVADRVDDAMDAAKVADRVDDAVDTADAADAALDARRAAWEQARREGRESVDGFVASMGDDALDSKEAALRVQGSRQGIGEMKHLPDDVKTAFNREMREVYTATDRGVVKDPRVLAEARAKHGIDFGDLTHDPAASRPGLQVYRDPAGNEIHLFEPTNAKPGSATVGADRDFTVYVKPAGSDVVTSMDRRVVKDAYRDAFYDAAGGDEMAARLGVQSKDDLLVRMDQAITDDLDPEAYTNVQTVLHQPYGELGDATQVGKTTTFKADHLFDRAESMGASTAAEFAQAEEWMGDGMRQVTKQFDNQVTARYEALSNQVDYLKRTGALPETYTLAPIDSKLSEAVDVMRQVQTSGVSPADVERQLHALGFTPRDVSAQVGDYLETMERLRPGPVIDLQQRMMSDPGLILAVNRP